MTQHFQVKGQDYFARGTAYTLLMASKTPLTLPGLPSEPAVDLMNLSDIEPVIAELFQKNGEIQLSDFPKWPGFERLSSNPLLAFHALYFLCHDDYSDDQRIKFVKSIEGKDFQPAIKALFWAMADFFDSLNRPLTALALRRSIEVAERLVQEMREAIDTCDLETEAIVKEYKRLAGGGSLSSSAFLESPRLKENSSKSGRSKNSSGTRKGKKRTT